MKKKLTGIAFLLLFILLTGQISAQEAVELKYNFVGGKSYIQSYHITQDNVQTMGSQEMRIQAGVELKQDFTVESAEGNGNATLLTSVTDIKLHTTMPGRDTTMSFTDLKEKTRIVATNKGRVLSTVKIDSSKVISSLGQMDVGKLKILPGRLVKQGESWQDTITENRTPSSGSPFSINIKGVTESTLAGKEVKDGKEYLKITYSGSMDVTGKGTQMGMELFIEGTGKVEGFYLFDKAMSLPVFSEDNTEMSMNIAVSGPQTMTIPMTQSVKMVMTTEEKK